MLTILKKDILFTQVFCICIMASCSEIKGFEISFPPHCETQRKRNIKLKISMGNSLTRYSTFNTWSLMTVSKVGAGRVGNQCHGIIVGCIKPLPKLPLTLKITYRQWLLFITKLNVTCTYNFRRILTKSNTSFCTVLSHSINMAVV